MAGKNISFSVEAKDKATGTLNNVSKELNKISKEMKNSPIQKFGQSWQNLTKSAKGFFFVTESLKTVAKAIKKCVDTAKEFEKEWANAEAVYKRFDFASSLNKDLGKSGTYFKQWANDLSSSIKGYFGDSDILGAMGGYIYEMTGEQLEKTTKAAVDLAAATGTDLNSAFQTLANTYNGTLSKSLKNQFSSLQDLTKEELANGDAIDIIAEKVKGAAEEMSRTTEGSLKRAQDAAGNLKKEIGAIFTQNLTPMRNFFSELMQGWADALQKKRMYEEAVAVSPENRNKDQARIVYEGKDEAWRKAVDTYNEAVRLYGKSDDEFYVKFIQDAYKEMQKAAEERTQADREYTKAIAEAKKAAQEQAKVSNKVVYELSGTNWKDVLNGFKSTNPLSYRTSQDYKVVMAQQNSTYRKAVEDWRAGSQDALKVVQHYEALWEQMWQDAVNKASAQGALANQPGTPGANQYSTFGGMGFSDLYPELTELGALFKESIQSISSINALLNWQSVIIDGFMEVVEPLVNEILAPMVGALKIVGVILGETIKPILQAIGIVLKPIYEGLTWLLNGLASVCNFISNVFIDIVNAIIRLVNKLPFVNISELAKNQVKTDYTSADLTATGTSALSNYSSGSATYSGARDVYITINYDHSYVNGDARDIALNLYNEFRMAEALGYAG